MNQSQVRLTTFKMYDGFSVKMTWTVFCTPHFTFSHRKSPQLQGTYTGINMDLLPATNTGKNLKLHHNSMYLTLMKCHNTNLNIPLVKSRFVIKNFKKTCFKCTLSAMSTASKLKNSKNIFLRHSPSFCI